MWTVEGGGRGGGDREGEAPRASALLPRLGVVVPQGMMRVPRSQMLSVDFLLSWRLLFAVSVRVLVLS
jgi:hypothetical protein